MLVIINLLHCLKDKFGHCLKRNHQGSAHRSDYSVWPEADDHDSLNYQEEGLHWALRNSWYRIYTFPALLQTHLCSKIQPTNYILCVCQRPLKRLPINLFSKPWMFFSTKAFNLNNGLNKCACVFLTWIFYLKLQPL